MQIEMMVSSAGPKGNRIAGKTYDVPKDEGEMLVKGGYAKVVDPKTTTSKVPAPKFESARKPEVDEDEDDEPKTPPVVVPPVVVPPVVVPPVVVPPVVVPPVKTK